MGHPDCARAIPKTARNQIIATRHQFSHELRTPLTAIRGYVEALLDDRSESDDATKFLEIITRTAGVERLVSGGKRLARLDARQEALESGAVRPAATIQHDNVAQTAEARDREIAS